MSDWRSRVKWSEWSYRKVTLPDGDCQYLLLAKTWAAGEEYFGKIDMDCAGEGVGESVAKMIVDGHNEELCRRGETGGMSCWKDVPDEDIGGFVAAAVYLVLCEYGLGEWCVHTEKLGRRFGGRGYKVVFGEYGNLGKSFEFNTREFKTPEELLQICRVRTEGLVGVPGVRPPIGGRT